MKKVVRHAHRLRKHDLDEILITAHFLLEKKLSQRPLKIEFGQNKMVVQRDLCVASPEIRISVFQRMMEQKRQELQIYKRKDENSVILGISRNSLNSIL